MFVVEHLPRAGTLLAYRFGINKIHKAVIDTGIVMTTCGMHRKPNPTFDSFSTNMNVAPYNKCERCFK